MLLSRGVVEMQVEEEDRWARYSNANTLLKL